MCFLGDNFLHGCNTNLWYKIETVLFYDVKVLRVLFYLLCFGGGGSPQALTLQNSVYVLFRFLFTFRYFMLFSMSLSCICIYKYCFPDTCNI